MKPLGTTWELHGQCLGTTWDNLENTIWNNNKCQRHHIHQTERQVNQLKRTKYTNQKPNAPTLFCLEAVQWWRTKDDKYEVDASKNYLNFPGRERCLQNGCWKDTSTRFNITQSYLVGKFNRNILRDEIYFQVTCCHFSGDSRHAVGLIFDIKLNLKWIQWLRLLETQILYKDVRVVVTWKKKCDILILTTMSRSAGLWTESWLFGIPGPATRYRLTVSLLSCVLETEGFMLHDKGDPSEVCVGDDLCLLAKRQPGGVRGHGQHAHHVQHQQQVWHHNQVILWTGSNIKSNKTFSSSKKIESPPFCKISLQGCQRSGEACQRDSWVSILFPMLHLCNSYFQGCWHTGVFFLPNVMW